MKGDPQILATLNTLLTGELSAADQYLYHAHRYLDWGLHALWERTHHEMEEERQHAQVLIERILFLEGTPDVASRDPLALGSDVVSMLKNDLALEYQVVGALRAAITQCEQLGDYQTRNELLPLLADTEEDHAHWLEQQLGLIDQIGLENYLQSQTGKAASAS